MTRPRWPVALAVGALLCGGCGARSAFGDASFGEIEDAFRQVGLEICESETADDGLASLAVRSRSYEVAADCTGDDRAQVVADEFDDVDHRDAAVRTFEVSVRPRGSGAVWTYGRTSVFVFGTSDDPVFEQVTRGLDEAGAQR
ncbi:MAG: hypothetical protein K0Q93_828 [Nocardioidaceae bacterium]|jgi:hypothetical protein|nr:hypothetical protein [Nocardioidaceae bacterium]